MGTLPVDQLGWQLEMTNTGSQRGARRRSAAAASSHTLQTSLSSWGSSQSGPKPPEFAVARSNQARATSGRVGAYCHPCHLLQGGLALPTSGSAMKTLLGVANGAPTELGSAANPEGPGRLSRRVPAMGSGESRADDWRGLLKLLLTLPRDRPHRGRLAETAQCAAAVTGCAAWRAWAAALASSTCAAEPDRNAPPGGPLTRPTQARGVRGQGVGSGVSSGFQPPPLAELAEGHPTQA